MKFTFHRIRKFWENRIFHHLTIKTFIWPFIFQQIAQLQATLANSSVSQQRLAELETENRQLHEKVGSIEDQIMHFYMIKWISVKEYSNSVKQPRGLIISSHQWTLRDECSLWSFAEEIRVGRATDYQMLCLFRTKGMYFFKLVSKFIGYLNL